MFFCFLHIHDKDYLAITREAANLKLRGACRETAPKIYTVNSGQSISS